VLGATGFIGRWVARLLSELEADLHVAVRDAGRMRELGREYAIRAAPHEVDLTRDGDLRALIQAVRPQVTFNLAGYGVDRTERDRELAYQINDRMLGVLAGVLAEQVPEAGWPWLRLVHVGSALEYGESRGDLAESSTPRPTTVYGKSKLAGTGRLVRASGEHSLAAVTARLFSVYGPGEHSGRLLPSLFEAARTGEPLSLTPGLQRRDFAYVEDVARGLLALALSQARAGEVVNLATGTLERVRDFALLAARVLRIPEERLHFGAVQVREEEMQHEPVRVDRLRELIGAPLPAALAEGIERAKTFLLP
jgi:nucleoside-diphosphate-sugar epimerase